jgi:hypothetical protein
MQHYVLIPLVSCIVSAMLAAGSGPAAGDPANRLAALVVSGATGPLRVLLEHSSDDQATVLWLVRASRRSLGLDRAARSISSWPDGVAAPRTRAR